jgi:hypothetical protein
MNNRRNKTVVSSHDIEDAIVAAQHFPNAPVGYFIYDTTRKRKLLKPRGSLEETIDEVTRGRQTVLGDVARDSMNVV